jgi:hypothetical protein
MPLVSTALMIHRGEPPPALQSQLTKMMSVISYLKTGKRAYGGYDPMDFWGDSI